MSWRYKLDKPEHYPLGDRYRYWRARWFRQLRNIRRAITGADYWRTKYPRLYLNDQQAEDERQRERRRQILPLQMLLRDLRMSYYYGRPNKPSGD